MQEYSGKEAFAAEIRKTADLYIKEFGDIAEGDKDLRLAGEERTPYENLSYQLGWMALIQKWEQEEKAGKTVEMPAPGIKWNQMGPLHEQFYAAYKSHTLEELKTMFGEAVDATCRLVESFEDEALFQPGGRNWAASTPSNWPVWKWVHINTVAPFKSFRAKIRKWKKQKAAAE